MTYVSLIWYTKITFLSTKGNLKSLIIITFALLPEFMNHRITLFLFLTFSLNVFSQSLERERSIESENIPQKALEFIFNATESSRVKWFYKTNKKGNSYLAKFNIKKNKIQIAFDLDSKFQDMEFEISKSKIPKKVKKSLRRYFKIYFNKYKLLRVTKQFKGGDETILQSKIKDNSILQASPTFYKMVVIGKKIENITSTEFLFDPDGNLVSSRKISVNNKDYLID